MKLAILTLGSPGARQLADTAQAMGLQVVMGDFKNEVAQKQLFKADILIPRVSHRLYEHAIHIVEQYAANNPSGFSAVSSGGIAHSFDKFFAYQDMIAGKIPTPVTFLVENIADAERYGDRLPLIIKPRNENQGRNIMVARTPQVLRDHVARLLSLYGSCIVQDFVEESAGRDIRAFVIGDMVFAAMERVAPDGKEIANLSSGGSARPVSLTEAEKAMSVQAARLFGASYAGIDLLRTTNGPVVLEVNVSPGLKIAEIVNVDLPTHIIRYLMSKTGLKHD